MPMLAVEFHVLLRLVLLVAAAAKKKRKGRGWIWGDLGLEKRIVNHYRFFFFFFLVNAFFLQGTKREREGQKKCENLAMTQIMYHQHLIDYLGKTFLVVRHDWLNFRCVEFLRSPTRGQKGHKIDPLLGILCKPENAPAGSSGIFLNFIMAIEIK